MSFSVAINALLVHSGIMNFWSLFMKSFFIECCWMSFRIWLTLWFWVTTLASKSCWSFLSFAISLKMTLCPHFLEILFLTSDLEAVTGTLRPEAGYWLKELILLPDKWIYLDVLRYAFFILSNGFYGIFPCGPFPILLTGHKVYNYVDSPKVVDYFVLA